MKTYTLSLILLIGISLVGCSKPAATNENSATDPTATAQTPATDTKGSVQVQTSPKATINPALNPDAVVGSKR